MAAVPTSCACTVSGKFARDEARFAQCRGRCLPHPIHWEKWTPSAARSMSSAATPLVNQAAMHTRAAPKERAALACGVAPPHNPIDESRRPRPPHVESDQGLRLARQDDVDESKSAGVALGERLLRCRSAVGGIARAAEVQPALIPRPQRRHRRAQAVAYVRLASMRVAVLIGLVESRDVGSDEQSGAAGERACPAEEPLGALDDAGGAVGGALREGLVSEVVAAQLQQRVRPPRDAVLRQLQSGQVSPLTRPKPN
eukprot:CAMPEP_0119394106 /NCGR_PEP_ID=MMETSP1334-20130426/127851_1 /TAXON_ID=127549 /ORGANISM="Calcidiscus leptoporus, Strain RCC1130" /LENGTH=255 /DNA_ID=CAMNT_0007417295 /DNA_START=107 /DNA_END=872 /DNA_ORIENTATION=+